MGGFSRYLTVIAFALHSLALCATPLSYTFAVTATGGPLNGASASGTFSYDSSVIVPNTMVNGLGLLSSLSFTWNGVTYNATSANTGSLVFGSDGQLTSFASGNHCNALGGCSVDQGSEQWFLGLPLGGSPYFVYATLGDGPPNVGPATISGPVVIAPVPVLSSAATVALLIGAVVGTTLALSRLKPRSTVMVRVA